MLSISDKGCLTDIIFESFFFFGGKMEKTGLVFSLNVLVLQVT